MNDLEVLSEYTQMAEETVASPKAPAELGSIFEQDRQGEALAGVPLFERKFHNARDPYYHIQREKPEHRIVLYLKAEGYSHREIAEISGLTTVAISNIIRQPWAQEELLRIIQSHGEPAVETILKGEAVNSVFKLIELRDSGESPRETQRKAANDILDRLFGKPNQPVQHSGNLDLAKLSDAELAKYLDGSSSSTSTSPA